MPTTMVSVGAMCVVTREDFDEMCDILSTSLAEGPGGPCREIAVLASVGGRSRALSPLELGKALDELDNRPDWVHIPRADLAAAC